MRVCPDLGPNPAGGLGEVSPRHQIKARVREAGRTETACKTRRRNTKRPASFDIGLCYNPAVFQFRYWKNKLRGRNRNQRLAGYDPKFVERLNRDLTERDSNSPIHTIATSYVICKREYCYEEGSFRGACGEPHSSHPSPRPANGGPFFLPSLHARSVR